MLPEGPTKNAWNKTFWKLFVNFLVGFLSSYVVRHLVLSLSPSMRKSFLFQTDASRLSCSHQNISDINSVALFMAQTARPVRLSTVAQTKRMCLKCGSLTVKLSWKRKQKNRQKKNDAKEIQKSYFDNSCLFLIHSLIYILLHFNKCLIFSTRRYQPLKNKAQMNLVVSVGF